MNCFIIRQVFNEKIWKTTQQYLFLGITYNPRKTFRLVAVSFFTLFVFVCSPRRMKIEIWGTLGKMEIGEGGLKLRRTFDISIHFYVLGCHSLTRYSCHIELTMNWINSLRLSLFIPTAEKVHCYSRKSKGIPKKILKIPKILKRSQKSQQYTFLSDRVNLRFKIWKLILENWVLPRFESITPEMLPNW